MSDTSNHVDLKQHNIWDLSNSYRIGSCLGVAIQIYIMGRNSMEELMFNYKGYWKSSSWLLKFSLCT